VVKPGSDVSVAGLLLAVEEARSSNLILKRASKKASKDPDRYLFKEEKSVRSDLIQVVINSLPPKTTGVITLHKYISLISYCSSVCRAYQA